VLACLRIVTCDPIAVAQKYDSICSAKKYMIQMGKCCRMKCPTARLADGGLGRCDLFARDCLTSFVLVWRTKDLTHDRKIRVTTLISQQRW
jgi:hypothetical protein